MKGKVGKTIGWLFVTSLLCLIFAPERAESSERNGPVVSLAFRLGAGIGLSPPNYTFHAKNAPLIGSSFSIRLFKDTWSEIRYDYMRTSLNPQKGVSNIGTLDAHVIGIIPIFFKRSIEKKWRLVLYPFSVVYFRPNFQERGDLYYYPGYGSYVYAVLDMTVEDQVGVDLWGMGFEYYLTKRLALDIEIWSGRILMPGMYLEVYELGKVEEETLHGLSRLFPISVGLRAFF